MNPPLMTEERVRVEDFRRKHLTGLVTLVFTDIVGSTALKQALGDREAVEQGERLIGPRWDEDSAKPILAESQRGSAAWRRSVGVGGFWHTP